MQMGFALGKIDQGGTTDGEALPNYYVCLFPKCEVQAKLLWEAMTNLAVLPI